MSDILFGLMMAYALVVNIRFLFAWFQESNLNKARASLLKAEQDLFEANDRAKTNKAIADVRYQRISFQNTKKDCFLLNEDGGFNYPKIFNILKWN